MTHYQWDRDELEELYWEKQLCSTEIAKLKDVDASAVTKAMTRLGLKKRTPSEVHTLLFLQGRSPIPFTGSTRGEKNPNWKGGRYKNYAGYIRVSNWDHPRSCHGVIFEHILVWEKANGCSVPEGYHIHHLNGIKDDNRPENLAAVSSSKHPPLTFQRVLQERIRQLEKKLEAMRDLIEKLGGA